MVTLTGTITDVTGRTPENISSITVKAPSARIGGGSDIIVTSNAQVQFDKNAGNLTLTGLHVGLSWLYIEGDGWSDSIPLAVAEGFQLILEAVANASGVPGIADYVLMIRNSESHAQLLARAAVDGEIGEVVRLAQAAATDAKQAATRSAQSATTAANRATTAENKVDSYTPRVDALEAMAGLSPESPVDGQTANLLTQPHTLTNAAAKTFTDPIVCSLQPTSLRSVAETTSGSIYPLEVFDGYMWGFTLGGGIHRQPATGGAWSSYAQAPVPSTVIRILPTGDGEVLVASGKQVHKSSGWATGSPTWTRKITVNGVTNILRGGIAGSGEKFIVTSYAADTGFPDSRYVYISLDAGNTWTLKYDSVALHGQVAADGSHVHAVEYDPWSDRFYVSEGHSNTGDIGGLYASDDDGDTWFRAEGMKKDPAPVTVTATNDGLVCGSDSTDNGLFGVLRAPIPEEEMKLVAEWKTGALGLNGFARHAFREPETGLVYVAFRSNHADVNPVIMAGSPLTGAIVYEFSPPVTSIQDRIESVVVPTPDRLYAHAISGPGTYTIISGKLGHPTARSVEDPGNILGGEAGTNDSVVVGRMASSGSALRSVVIGRGAKLSPDVNDQHSVLIGESATSSGTNVVAIGRAAKGTAYSVVIGSDADPGAISGTVLVGQGTSVSGGGQNVAIGWRASARAQSVSVGDTATSVANSSKATAIGYSAMAGTDSVAVGAATSSGISLRSVVLGAGATLSDTIGTQNHVVIGQAATSTGANSVVIGQGATGAEASVVIGKGVSGAFPSTVLIGQGSVSDGGGGAVAVGFNTFARANSVVIGLQAASVAASARTVSVGYEAKSHTDSVALGSSTETTQSFQVAVGARSLYVKNRANVPAAPTDGGQLYAQGGSLYWINSSGVSTKIAPVT